MAACGCLARCIREGAWHLIRYAPKLAEQMSHCAHCARGSGFGILISPPIVRALPLPNNIALFIVVHFIAAGSPYAIVVAVAGLLLSVASHRVVMSVIVLVVFAANLVIQAP